MTGASGRQTTMATWGMARATGAAIGALVVWGQPWHIAHGAVACTAAWAESVSVQPSAQAKRSAVVRATKRQARSVGRTARTARSVYRAAGQRCEGGVNHLVGKQVWREQTLQDQALDQRVDDAHELRLRHRQPIGVGEGLEP